MEKYIKAVTGYFKKLFEKDIVLKIASIVVAIIIWFTISVFKYPTKEDVFYKVPVQVDMTGTYAEAFSLQPVSIDTEYVTVYVSGQRTEISNMKSADLVAYADASSVKDARTYKLGLNVKSRNGHEFTVTSVEPDIVDVTFDEIISKTFPVEADISSIKVNIKDGYMKGTSLVTPGQISLTGPKEKINSIGKVSVEVTSDDELNMTTELNAEGIKMFNKSGALIDNNDDMITADKQNFTVQVPVYVKKTIPLEVSVVNEPENFDKQSFIDSLVISPSELIVAAPDDKINLISKLNIGTIDMRKVDIGSVFEFNTSDFLPQGYEDLNQIKKATVTYPSDNLLKKAYPIRGSDVQFINVPGQFNYQMITSGFTVFFIGPSEIMDKLTTKDIVATIDMIDFDMTEGDKKLPVTFSVPAYPEVWCTGSEGALTPTAIVTATRK